MSLSALYVSVLSCLLALLSSHYTYQHLGLPIIKTLLAPQWMRRLNAHIAGSHSELILVTLKLVNGMSSFAGGRERKHVMDALHWDHKVCQKLMLLYPVLLIWLV